MSRFTSKTTRTVRNQRRAAAAAPIIAPVGGASAGARSQRINASREYLNPLRGLTISRAVRLLEDYQVGRMADVQWAYYFTEMTDPDLIALLALRVGRIVEMDYNLFPEDGGDEALIEEQTDLLTEKLAAIDNLYEAIEHLAMAPFRGYSHVEKHLGPDGEVVHFEPVDQWNVVRDGLRGPWKYNPTAKSADYRSIEGEDLPLERFLYREVRRPINRFALLKFVRGGLSEKDWDAFNEIYNVPGGVVIGPPDVPEGDEAEYEDAASEVATGGNGYLPYGSQYVPNKMPHDPQTFKLRLDYLSEKLVLAGTGGKLTMLTSAGSGTLAGGAHAEVFDRIAAADAKRISEIITTSLVTQWLDEAFPGQDHVVWFGLAANEETDSAAAVDQVDKLSRAGFQIDPEQVTQKTGWRVTLKAPTPAAPDMGNAVAPDSSMPPITNRDAAAAGDQERFLASAMNQLGAADRKALQPVIDRVQPIRDSAAKLLETTDDAEFAKGYAELETELMKLREDLPALEKQCLGDKASGPLDRAFSAIIGSAMANGMDSGASARREKPIQNVRKSPRGYQSTHRAAKRPGF